MSDSVQKPVARWKKRVFYALVGIFALWPPLHFGLSKILDISPWKLGGWGMYAEPSRTFRLKAESLTEIKTEGGGTTFVAEPLQFSQLETEPRDNISAALGKFKDMRVQFCELYPPDGVADAFFAGYPDVDQIRITVFRFGLNRKTAMGELKNESEYDYERPGN